MTSEEYRQIEERVEALEERCRGMSNTISKMEGTLGSVASDVGDIKRYLMSSNGSSANAALKAIVQVVIAVMVFGTFALVGYMAMKVNARHGDTRIDAAGQQSGQQP